jgi:hypothetical protein
LTSERELPIRDFGRKLFDFVFPTELRAQLIASRQQAAHEGEPLRVRLRVDPPELAALPWEFLYDPGRDDYLCLIAPLVRYIDVLEARRPMAVAPPLRVLAMVARPDELDPLDLHILVHEAAARPMRGLNASAPPRLSVAGMRSFRTCAVDTTNSVLIPSTAAGSRQASPNSPLPFEQRLHSEESACSFPTQQRPA